MEPGHREWLPAEPADAAAWLANLAVPWWIAGGWAIDLFAGRCSRTHHDLDVGILRRDIQHLHNTLSGWEIFEARAGALTPLAFAATPQSDTHSLWCRPAGAAAWHLEVMLDESEGNSWIYRREPLIRRRLSTVIRTNHAGFPYLTPEIQLLYKAKALRAKDAMDFDRIHLQLDTAARNWLRDSLILTQPGHPWMAILK